MRLADFRRLKSMMERTFSDNDPEALAAIRAANRLLASEDLTWSRVLDRSCRVEVPFEPAPGHDADESMEALFIVAIRDARGSFQDMLEDMYAQWQEKHWLSDRQREIVVEAAEKARGLR